MAAGHWAGLGKLTAAARQMPEAALDDAGVTLGTYDCQVADWLAGWEPEMVMVVVVRAWPDRGRLPSS